MGWSFLGQKEWKRAVAQFKRFENRRPGNGMTSQFLGRAYIGLRRYDQAELYLKQSIRRDPNLTPEALFYMAVADEARGRRRSAKRKLDKLLKEKPRSWMARMVSKEARVQALKSGTVRKPKAWGINLAGGGGYNQNALMLGRGVARPGNIGRKGSGFANFDLGGIR